MKMMKAGQVKHPIEGKGNAGDFFSFYFPQCHPDYISATC